MCDNNHKINIKIKNKDLQTFYEKEHLGFLIKGFEKQMLIGYVMSEYRDLTNLSKNIEMIQVYCGDDKVYDFNY